MGGREYRADTGQTLLGCLQFILLSWVPLLGGVTEDGRARRADTGQTL